MNMGIVRRKFGTFFGFVFIACLLSIVLYWGTSKLFSIQVVEVIGEDVRVIVDEKKISKNLLFFPSDKLREDILRDNPLLLDVRFKKLYPHTLQIIPTPRVPFIRLQSADRLVLVDRDGVVLQDGDQGLSLPLIQLTLSPFRVGEVIPDKRIGMLLTFIDMFQESLPIESITEYDSSSFQVKTGKTDIYITQDKPIQDTMATLQTLMAGFRIKGTLPAVVDLRFDKPIVKL